MLDTLVMFFLLTLLAGAAYGAGFYRAEARGRRQVAEMWEGFKTVAESGGDMNAVLRVVVYLGQQQGLDAPPEDHIAKMRREARRLIALQGAVGTFLGYLALVAALQHIWWEFVVQTGLSSLMFVMAFRTRSRLERRVEQVREQAVEPIEDL